MRKQTKKAIAIIMTAFMLANSGGNSLKHAFAASAAEVDIAVQSTVIHDIFYAKDDSKLEKFKERVYNGLLYKKTAIDVSDLDIRPEEIVSQTAIGPVSGTYGAAYLVRNHPFYSTAATVGYPTFTYKENGCVETVKYEYHPAWNTAFIESVIASYDEVMALIHEGDSDFAKILKFHDWIVKNVAYKLMGSYADYAVGALANRGAVCAGYAQLYQFLLDQEGIENIYIAAQTKTEQHAWNLVKYEGHWFHVDCTWDRGVGMNTNVNHWYFMMSDDEFNANGQHTEDWKDPQKKYPTGNECTIKNKFWESNTGIASDEQIAQNPVVLEHKFDADTPVISQDKNGHTRKCLSGQLVTEPHNLNDSICADCGRDTKNDQETGGGEKPPTEPTEPAPPTEPEKPTEPIPPTDPANPTIPGDQDTSTSFGSTGHTMFNVFESASRVSRAQITFEVPLYVTMAAVNGATEMVVPNAEEYYIRNHSGNDENGERQAIGICGIKVEVGDLWSIKETPKTKYEMSFALGGYAFENLEKKEKKTLFDRTDWDKKLTETNSFFLKAADNAASGNTKPGLVRITDKLELPMMSTIAKTERRNSSTAVAFRVIYTLCAVDEQGQPMPSTYVGNNRDEAFKEVIGVQ